MTDLDEAWKAYQQGIIFHARNYPALAIKQQQIALERFQAVCATAPPGSADWTTGRSGQRDVHVGLGIAYHATLDIGRGFDELDQALEIARELSAAAEVGSETWDRARQGEATVHQVIAQAHRQHWGQIGRAYEHLNEAIAIARERCDALTASSPAWIAARTDLVAALQLAGEVCGLLGWMQASSAEAYFKQAVQAAHETAGELVEHSAGWEEARRAESRAYESLAGCLRDQGQDGLARVSLWRAAQRLQEVDAVAAGELRGRHGEALRWYNEDSYAADWLFADELDEMLGLKKAAGADPFLQRLSNNLVASATKQSLDQSMAAAWERFLQERQANVQDAGEGAGDSEDEET